MILIRTKTTRLLSPPRQQVAMRSVMAGARKQLLTRAPRHQGGDPGGSRLHARLADAGRRSHRAFPATARLHCSQRLLGLSII